MKSHHYDLNKKRVIGLIVGPLVMLGFISLAVRSLAILPGMPSPRPVLDVDRTVIIHQIDAAQSTVNADIVLLGDSSCLMNIDATLMETLTASKVINLGLLSYLDLQTFSHLLAHYLSNQEHPPSQIILITHPDFVRKSAASPAHQRAFGSYIDQQDDNFRNGTPWDPRRLVGTHIVEGRLLSRVPTPLPGAFGRRFGFTTDFLQYMTAHQGSAIDPRRLDASKLSGSSDYRVARFHTRQAPSFAEVIPPTTRLIIGLSPMPNSFPSQSYPAEYQKLLSDWSQHFPTNTTLTQLPATLDDHDFATKTHLTATAAQEYTRTLVQMLESLSR